MAEEDKSLILRKVSLFKNIPEKVLSELGQIVKETTVEAGVTVFNEGDPGDAIYIIKSGRVNIVKHSSNKTALILATLTDGAVLGEMAVIDELPRSASVVAVSRTQFFKVTKDDFNRLLNRTPEFSLPILKVISERLRITNFHLAEVKPPSFFSKVLLYLVVVTLLPLSCFCYFLSGRLTGVISEKMRIQYDRLLHQTCWGITGHLERITHVRKEFSGYLKRANTAKDQSSRLKTIEDGLKAILMKNPDLLEVDFVDATGKVVYSKVSDKFPQFKPTFENTESEESLGNYKKDELQVDFFVGQSPAFVRSIFTYSDDASSANGVNTSGSGFNGWLRNAPGVGVGTSDSCGKIILYYSMEPFYQLMSWLNPGVESVFIADESGKILFDSNKGNARTVNELFADCVDSRKVLANFLDSASGSKIIEKSPGGSFLFHETLMPNSWKIGLEIVGQRILGEMKSVTRSAIGILLLVVLIITFAFWRLLTSILKPINTVIQRLTENAERVASDSSEAAGGCEKILESTNNQMIATRRIIATLETNSRSISQSSHKMAQVMELNRHAGNLGNEGNATVETLGDAIKRIKNAAAEVSQIIKSIEKIAFKTNILALNAAVEAARAGQAGVGFAVLAEEMRELSIRTSELAKSTEGLIGGAKSSAEYGEQVALKVTGTINAIITEIQKYCVLLSEIAQIHVSETKGIDEIRKALETMDEVSRENIEVAGDGADIGQRLAKQAQELYDIVVVLKSRSY